MGHCNLKCSLLLGLLQWLLYIRISFADEFLKCKTMFYQYHPSPLEKKWTDNVDSWQLDVCKHISDDEMNWWIGNVSVVMKDVEQSALITTNPDPPNMPWSYIFSIFTYKKFCIHKSETQSTTEYVHIPIEPTAAIARDPRKVRNCYRCISQQ